MREAKGINKNTFSNASGKNERGTMEPDKNETIQFFIRLAPHRYLITKAIKPKHILKKKLIRYANTQLVIYSKKFKISNCTAPVKQ